MIRDITDTSCSIIPLPGGGVVSAQGFRACGVHAGFRRNPNRLDMALVVADQPCACAGMFTQNVFCAAPVRLCREYLLRSQGSESYGTMRAMVINSGNANAATGEPGLQDARDATALVADALGCPTEEVLIASTGVIGVYLSQVPFETGLPLAIDQLSRHGGSDAAMAIMTTDTCPKEYAVSFPGDDLGYPNTTFTVGGMTKGSGMIMPSMATMIAVITTDVPLLPIDASGALQAAVSKSFNKVTVDSDTSTNDTCVLFASGMAAPQGPMFAPETRAFAKFQQALDAVCIHLARAMAADGEGASKLVTVHVTGAASDVDADLAARSIANSPLVKTAICGHDANWGRIAMAIGKSGAQFRQENASIDIMGMPVCRDGLPVPFNEDEALRRFEEPEITIDVDLGSGAAETTIWTCDMTHDYIAINGDYRT